MNVGVALLCTYDMSLIWFSNNHGLVTCITTVIIAHCDHLSSYFWVYVWNISFLVESHTHFDWNL